MRIQRKATRTRQQRDPGQQTRVTHPPAGHIPFNGNLLERTASSQTVQRQVIQFADYYAYGDADSDPHVHVYPGGSHLQIHHRGRTRRYNIVQDGDVHVQAATALEAAGGNAALRNVILDQIRAAGGSTDAYEPAESKSSKDDDDDSPDDFKDMSALWKHLGQKAKARRRGIK